MPCNHLILCCPLLLPPSIVPSIRVFSNEWVLHIRWPKYWSFSFSISPSDESSGLIYLRMDRLDLLAVQGTLKSLFQHHSSKASILRHSAFFIIQLSHPYTTTGKTIALTRRTFVGKAMSLLFNMLSRLVITFLPRTKHLSISWLQSSFVVILEPPKIKSLTVSPFICHEVMGPDAMILVSRMLSFKPTFSLCSHFFFKLYISFISTKKKNQKILSNKVHRMLSNYFTTSQFVRPEFEINTLTRDQELGHAGRLLCWYPSKISDKKCHLCCVLNTQAVWQGFLKIIF